MPDKRIPCKECNKLISKYQAKNKEGLCGICAARKKRLENE